MLWFGGTINWLHRVWREEVGSRAFLKPPRKSWLSRPLALSLEVWAATAQVLESPNPGANSSNM